MKVLHVIPGVAMRYGGPSQAIFQMCQALQKQGVEPLIATTDADGPGRLPVPLAHTVTCQGTRVILFSRQWSEAFKYSRPLSRWLQTNVTSFDLVHIHAVFSHSSIAAARACLWHQVPYVVRPLGSLDPWSLYQKRVRKRLLWHTGVRRMLHGAAALHYTTASEQRLAEQALGDTRGTVIPLGIEEELLQIQDAPTTSRYSHPALAYKQYVLILCRLHPKKGLDLFLEVFLEVTRKNEFQHWRLVLAGDGELNYVTSLKQLVQEHNGTDRILFTGWLDGEGKTAALHGAALLALPSHQENFGLAAVEALACGVPVLISTHVNLADDVQAAGAGWITLLERTALVQTLTEALHDECERTRRGAAGRALVRSRFTWPAVGAELVQLYRIILQQ
jgi:glycosyltransferase involved in cell wall biosynthesis